MVILDMEVVKSADEVAGKIGEPQPYVEGESSAHTAFLTITISYSLGG